MAESPRFIVSFRGVEIGRYETADLATAAARSVLEAEAGARFGSAPVSEPVELPVIEYQPPRLPVPFDGMTYLRQRVQPPPPPGPPAPPLPRRIAAPESPVRVDMGVATVYGGPVPQAREDAPAPTAVVRTGPVPPVPPPSPDPPAPTAVIRTDPVPPRPAPPPTMHGGPTYWDNSPRPPAPVYGAPPPNPYQQPQPQPERQSFWRRLFGRPGGQSR
jgi:hypothetical protein